MKMISNCKLLFFVGMIKGYIFNLLVRYNNHPYCVCYEYATIMVTI